MIHHRSGARLVRCTRIAVAAIVAISSCAANPGTVAPDMVAPDSTVPPGMQAVSALGVEVFAPAAWTNDDPCSAQLRTPVDTAILGARAYSCGTPARGHEPPELSIDGSISTEFGCDRRIATITLGTARGCIAPSRDGSGYGFSVRLPSHIQIVVRHTDRATALGVLRSAHTTTRDHAGCSDQRQLLPTETLSADPRSLRVCVYQRTDFVIGEPLVSSGRVDGARADALVGALNGSTSGPRARPCSRTVGVPPFHVTVSAEYADGRQRTVLLQNITCAGLVVVRSATDRRPVGAATLDELRAALGLR